MKPSFIPIREFSRKPAGVFRRMAQDGPQVITQNGRPAAIVIPASIFGLESDLDAVRQIFFNRAVDAIRRDSILNGTDEIASGEIDAEIKLVRAARRRRRAKRAKK